MKQEVCSSFLFASFFPSKITMAGVRQLLAEDLELDKDTLYPFKKFISQQVDEVSEPC